MIIVTTDACVQVGNDPVVTYRHKRGERLELPSDVEALFITHGYAVPVAKAERAVKPRGERATKSK